MTSVTNIALEIAKQAHKGQLDKGGIDYIEHPLAVANIIKSDKFFQKIINDKKYEFKENILDILTAIAYLHDVLEDSWIDSQYLINNGIPIEVVNCVETLTRSTDKSYFDYISDIKSNYSPYPSIIKMADLLHNMDYSRLKVVTQNDLIRFEKYKKAFNILKARFDL